MVIVVNVVVSKVDDVATSDSNGWIHLSRRKLLSRIFHEQVATCSDIHHAKEAKVNRKTRNAQINELNVKTTKL